MHNSKEKILNNIKNALGDTKTDFVYADSLFKGGSLISEHIPEQLVGEFTERLESLSGTVEVLEDDDKLADSIEKIFERTKSNSFFGWETKYLISIYEKLAEKGYEHNKSADTASRSKCDAGITLADYAISETGTIVLYNDHIQNRNASLIAPVHIAVLSKEKIVRNIFDLFGKIFNDYKGLDGVNELSNCVTFISGPSRTADIELNLTLGVHGPKELFVLII